MLRDQRVVNIFTTFSDLILAVHVTNQRLYNKFDFVLKVQCKLQGNGEIERWTKLMKDILYFADTLSKVKVSYKTQQDTLERRKRLMAEKKK